MTNAYQYLNNITLPLTFITNLFFKMQIKDLTNVQKCAILEPSFGREYIDYRL